MPAPLLSADWCWCTKPHREAVYDFWIASVLANLRSLVAPRALMLDHAIAGLDNWLETWRTAS